MNPTRPQTILARFETVDAFEDALEEAEQRDDLSAWEENFLADIRERFDKWGDDMYLTDNQADKILAIRDR